MLSHPAGPRLLAAALTDLMRWLTEEGISGAIVGGIAVSIRGRPRVTDDIDAVILGDELGWDIAVESAASYGITPRIENVIEFAARTRVLLLHHTASGIDLDVSLGGLQFEAELVARSSLIDVGAVRLQVATAEDLIIMKALARRPRDIADIEGILDTNPNLDLDRIREQLREFSSVLEMPEIQEDFERLVRAMRRM
jgi:predicted nucleotidyltransferase